MARNAPPRHCRRCGTSVADEPYGRWLFHICAYCARDVERYERTWSVR